MPFRFSDRLTGLLGCRLLLPGDNAVVMANDILLAPRCERGETSPNMNDLRSLYDKLNVSAFLSHPNIVEVKWPLDRGKTVGHVDVTIRSDKANPATLKKIFDMAAEKAGVSLTSNEMIFLNLSSPEPPFRNR